MPTPFTIKDQYAPYFLTFQVRSWIDVFSRKIYRDIVVDSFNYCIDNKALSVHAWVIMTIHVHCIVSSKDGTLSNTIRDLKRHTSKAIVGTIKTSKESRRTWMLEQMRIRSMDIGAEVKYRFWTPENHAVEISRHYRDIGESRFHYVHENPVRAGWVHEREEYVYSSARDYAGRPGLIKLVKFW